jgi:hypothetical protein
VSTSSLWSILSSSLAGAKRASAFKVCIFPGSDDWMP